MRHDPARIALLEKLLILESAPESAYDDLAKAIAENFGVPVGLVNLLDRERDWFKGCFGSADRELPSSTSFCESFFSTTDDLILVEDTTQAPRFARHPLVLGPPFIRFYAAGRLKLHGQTVGALCTYDTKPHRVNSAQMQQLDRLRRLAIELLQLRAEAVGA